MLIRLFAIPLVFFAVTSSQAQDAAKPANESIDSKERAIAFRLKQPISLNFKDVPLRKAIKAIALQAGFTIEPDLTALKDARVNLDAPLTMSVEDGEMRAALRILLGPLRLRFMIEDGKLMITTQEKGRNFVRKWYGVADLVQCKSIAKGGQKVQSREHLLIAIVENAVEKESWQSAGGRGIIKYCALDRTLEVHQYADVHEEVHELLKALAVLQSLNVGLELRLMYASQDTAQRIRKNMANFGKPALATLASGFQDQDRAFFRFFKRFPDRVDGEPIQFNVPSPLATLHPGMFGEILSFVNADRKSRVIEHPIIWVRDQQVLPIDCVQKHAVSIHIQRPAPDEFGPWAQIPLPANASSAKETLKVEEKQLSQQEKILSRWRSVIQPSASLDKQSIRLALEIEHFMHDDETATDRNIKAACTVLKVANGHTLIWYLGESGGASNAERQQLFFAVTPQIRGGEEIVVTTENQKSNAPIPGR